MQLLAAKDGGALAAASIFQKTFSARLLLLRVAADGSKLWERIFDKEEFGSDFPQVALFPDGEVLISGTDTASGALLLLRLNPDGTLRWKKTILLSKGDVSANSLIPLPDSGAAIGGTYGESEVRDYWHSNFLIRVDQDGRMLWEKTIDHPGARYEMSSLYDVFIRRRQSKSMPPTASAGAMWLRTILSYIPMSLQANG